MKTDNKNDWYLKKTKGHKCPNCKTQMSWSALGGYACPRCDNNLENDCAP
jgi:transcription initiation factor IIE alpha subunit